MFNTQTFKGTCVPHGFTKNGSAIVGSSSRVRVLIDNLGYLLQRGINIVLLLIKLPRGALKSLKITTKISDLG